MLVRPVIACLKYVYISKLRINLISTKKNPLLYGDVLFPPLLFSLTGSLTRKQLILHDTDTILSVCAMQCATHFLAYCSSCIILSGLLSMSIVLIPTERLLSPAAAMLWLLARPEAAPCLEMELGAVSELVR